MTVQKKTETLLSLKIKTGSYPEVHFIVSKNIFRTAVLRNLVKRRLRHATKTSLKNFPKNKILFFTAHKGLEKIKYTKLQKIILDVTKNLI